MDGWPCGSQASRSDATQFADRIPRIEVHGSLSSPKLLPILGPWFYAPGMGKISMNPSSAFSPSPPKRWPPLHSPVPFLGLILFMCAITADSARAATTLAAKGKTSYRIVLPADAIPSERYAAQELQHYLEKMTGVGMPIVADTEPRRQPRDSPGQQPAPGQIPLTD